MSVSGPPGHRALRGVLISPSHPPLRVSQGRTGTERSQVTCPRSHFKCVLEQGVDLGQDVSEVCGLSPEPGHLSPVVLEVQDSSRPLRVAMQSPTKTFQEASGGQIWPALSGREFQNQESRQNVFFLPEGCQGEDEYTQLLSAHTHLRTLAGPSGLPGLPSPPRPGACAEDWSDLGLSH